MSEKKRNIKVCFTPALFSKFSDRRSIVIVVDVLRATSCICTALAKGVISVKPVEHIFEMLDIKNNSDYILAAERNGKIVKGFKYGNSPLMYSRDEMKGKKVILTTTNGTKSIELAKKDHTVIVGAFINLHAVTQWVLKKNKDVIVMCAGWQDRFNLEDSLFAGALVESLMENEKFDVKCDSALAARSLYNLAKNDMYSFLSNSSHRHRMKDMGIEEDVRYCLTLNKVNIVPILKEDVLVIDES